MSDDEVIAAIIDILVRNEPDIISAALRGGLSGERLGRVAPNAFGYIVETLQSDLDASSGTGEIHLPDEAYANGDIATAVPVLGAGAWRFLVAHVKGEQRIAMSRVADRFFAAVYRLERAIVAGLMDESRQSSPGLDRRGAIAEALIAGRPLPEAGLVDGSATDGYVTICIGFSSGVDRRACLHRLAVAPRWQHVLPAFQEQDLVLIVPLDVPTAAQEITAIARETLAEMKIGPMPAGVAYALTDDGVSEAVEEARMIMQVARSLDYPHPYVLEDVCVEALLVRSPDLAARLGQRLEPLAARGGYLLDTLRAYIASGRRRVETATRLHIHPNTLDYRLRKVKTLTGLSITSVRDVQTLSVGLVAWQLYDQSGDD
ncbi:helix-turn-helix domain-containing protein [Actinoplanes sp. NPDC026670]|uniref:PucR family transcriptional regulator n=1 Tax=Actinoplanes sp. NPDC026670 TaxID=3154700 RepID=UPI0033D865BA